MPDPILAATRLSWDDHDPWGSAMSVLGACCDFFTVARLADAGYAIPASVGYRPAVGLSLETLVTDAETDGFEYGWHFEDFTLDCVADALGFSLFHIESSGGVDLVASNEDWNAAAPILIRTMTILDRYIDLCVTAGKDY